MLQGTTLATKSEQSHKESLRPAWRELDPGPRRGAPARPARPRRRRDRGGRGRGSRLQRGRRGERPPRRAPGARRVRRAVVTGCETPGFPPARSTRSSGPASSASGAASMRCSRPTGPEPRSPGAGSPTPATAPASTRATSTRWPRRSSPTSTRSRPPPQRASRASSLGRLRAPGPPTPAGRPAPARATGRGGGDRGGRPRRGVEAPRPVAVLAFEADRPDRVASRLPAGASPARLTAACRGRAGPRRAEATAGGGSRPRGRPRRAGARPWIGATPAPSAGRDSRSRSRRAGRGARRRLGSPPRPPARPRPRTHGRPRAKRLARLTSFGPASVSALSRPCERGSTPMARSGAAAERLHVHTQTVRYRLAQLEELFGEDLAEPGTLDRAGLARRSEDSGEPDCASARSRAFAEPPRPRRPRRRASAPSGDHGGVHDRAGGGVDEVWRRARRGQAPASRRGRAESRRAGPPRAAAHPAAASAPRWRSPASRRGHSGGIARHVLLDQRERLDVGEQVEGVVRPGTVRAEPQVDAALASR